MKSWIVKLGYLPVKVAVVADPFEGNDRYGECEPKRAVVRISEELPTELLLETLIHELLHIQCGRLFPSINDGSDENETLINFFAKTFSEILISNKLEWWKLLGIKQKQSKQTKEGQSKIKTREGEDGRDCERDCNKD